jgi:hypothetical protein
LLLGGLGGAAAGTAGGFAAAGATTAAVMALGTASTGAAISGLSGAAATNATLALLGGGPLAAGGGGIAAGAAMLSAATLGVGLLVGGIIFNFTGGKLSDKADETWSQMLKAEEQINNIRSYMQNLNSFAIQFLDSLTIVNNKYQNSLSKLWIIIELNKKLNWNLYTYEEKLLTENTVLLVNLLYQMGKVQLVIKSNSSNELNQVNCDEINKKINDAKNFLYDRLL